MNPGFWRGKRVFLSGHTGFKGAWLALWLEQLEASVTGYSLPPPTDPALFEELEPWRKLDSIISDLRDREALDAAIAQSDPEIVIHMAAQSLVRASYQDPVETFSTNVMGTVNLLDAVRSSESARATLVITSDKVYDQAYGAGDFVEDDRLGGTDPYAASKAAQELVTASFCRSYFEERGMRLATGRAGNVIGGGDWAADRLIPDYFRSVRSGEPFRLRYPAATRPWQHVLEPLNGYLTYLEHLYSDEDSPVTLNFGPDEAPVAVADVVAKLAAASGHDNSWSRQGGELWPEHTELRLASEQAVKVLDWRPRLSLEEAIAWTAGWYQAHGAGRDMRAFSVGQIEAYTGLVA
jgi:CDP-glucose 4,6-dehydratase